MINDAKYNKIELQRIQCPQHAARVSESLAEGFEDYFAEYISAAPVRHEQFLKKLKNYRSNIAISPEERLQERFAEAVKLFTKNRENDYDGLLDAEALGEYAHDVKQFVHDFLLLPLINNARHAPLETMEKWQMKLSQSARKNPKAFFDVVRGVSEFADTFGQHHSWESLRIQTDPALLPFDAFSTPHPEEQSAQPRPILGIPGVVGPGITSMLMYYRNPELLPARSRFALAAMHFLSEQGRFGLESNEFIIWNTHTNNCSTNYLYPYSVFYFHAVRLADLLQDAVDSLGVEFPTNFRMVLLEDFFKFVSNKNQEEIDSWIEGAPYYE
ncbi:MAG: hypothetical protein SFY68_08425 [Candidatus Sumerlaeia bacterium]|nr:hypothetical protein [Candidatus Sumerlaeia bacterium]